MGISGSKPPTEILLLIQSCNKQSYIPYSTVMRGPGLAENVDEILKGMRVANQAGSASYAFDYPPSPGRWVLVDLGNASIINREFLRELVFPGGCYMVLSKHFLALSKDELVGIKGQFNIPRQYISPQAAYKFPVYKFIFPAHELQFIVPHPVARGLDVEVQRLTKWLEAAIDYIAREVSENHGNIRNSTLMVPSGGSWVVRHGEDLVIYKAFLGEMLVPSREYMVIPTHAVNMSTGDLSQAMGPASHRMPPRPPPTQSPSPSASASPYSTCTMTPTLNPLSSPSVSSCSTYTLTPRQSPDRDGSVVEEEEEMVELKITRAEDCSIQYYRIPSSWTIGLAIVNLDVSQGARLVEAVGFFRSFDQYSQESLAELGWGGQGGVMELYLVDDTVIKTESG